MSPPILTKKGFHIVRVLEAADAGKEPLTFEVIKAVK
ncbi:hypothetical protein M2322_003911 [Rhodoblastus acidophilus]|nr:hypothetical protein [Rhodoblastus acidophilus]